MTLTTEERQRARAAAHRDRIKRLTVDRESLRYRHAAASGAGDTTLAASLKAELDQIEQQIARETERAQEAA